MGLDDLVHEAQETVRVVAARVASEALTAAAVHEARPRLYEAEAGQRHAERRLAAQQARLKALMDIRRKD